MQVEELSLPRRQAEEEFKTLKEAFKRNAKLRKEEVRKDLLAVYGHLRHGKKIVDIYESFRKAGLNEDGDPRLAICRADAKECFCLKVEDGSAIFSMKRLVRAWDPVPRKSYGDVKIPSGTFQWKLKDSTQPVSRWNVLNPSIKCLVPTIPAKILVEEVRVLLRNFHILWEVEEWKPVPLKTRFC
ncbi:MAG: hypothetical protein QMD13_07165 [Candidatus Bathyarchaeia archaeon]|nr:hypothetical protein [Candidatus Bathyarchaeia archaeon]